MLLKCQNRYIWLEREREFACRKKQSGLPKDIERGRLYAKGYGICKEYLKNSSWPGYHTLHPKDQKLWKVYYELHVEEQMLFNDHKLVIPKRLRTSIVYWLHGSHLRIDKTVAKGHSLYYWPGMTGEVEHAVRSCVVCEMFQRHP